MKALVCQAGGGCLGPVHALAPGKWPFFPIIPSLQICSLALSVICRVFVRAGFLKNPKKPRTIFADSTMYIFESSPRCEASLLLE